ncbi:MAG: bifunctional demethylmenaquinone methyltransferase/2-methoxy-6-polyprenyl-1,4-benzoquinol methylase UbiE [Verrucomicrobia bacterium]|nr:MAG: bifunctional demethylmenaquinone methyltransferase/2-methoxy-6-polyprenyl-1,4-benzoquinol methylase UbiE [Verrucomicrobiota bacterium]
MFDRVARRYDLANHLLSFGRDFFWRRRSAEIVAEWNPACVLDLATGSGDLALALQHKISHAQIVGLDFSSAMLALARGKGVRHLIAADVAQLPLAEQSFDAVTVAFGLRNVHDWAAALREIRRVLTSGGHLLVLDFSLPSKPILHFFYRLYLRRILPLASAIITREKEAYQYLGASIENFPSGRAMCDLIATSGFQNVTAESFTGGIVTIYTAEV